MKFHFRFESNASDGGYVGVMRNSPVFKGPIASQNAGSSDPGLYYIVDGGGLNQQFHDAFGATQRAQVKRCLEQAYDKRFGADAWANDGKTARGDRLTSLYVPIPMPLPHDAKIGTDVQAMVYSVGPHLHGSIVDRDTFRQVYVDALEVLAQAQRDAGAGTAPMALRLTLLSTGIYGGVSADTAEERARLQTDLCRDVAALVLEAVSAAAGGAYAANLPTTLLINADQSAGTGTGKEFDAFKNAAAARGIPCTTAGFDLDV